MGENQKKITICMGSSCFTRGNNDNLKVIQEYLAVHNLEAEVSLTGALCKENCRKGPVIFLNETMHTNVGTADLPDLLDAFCRQQVKKNA